MITYIAIYMGIGFAAFCWGLYEERRDFDVTVKHVISIFTGLVFLWPIFLGLMLIDWLGDDMKFFKKLLRTVVIKKKERQQD